MDEIWTEIKEDYETAKFALWCPKHCSGWSRDEDKGFYYLWKAYYTALTAEKKEPLLYARILMMMGFQQNNKQSDWERLHRYYLPAKKQYQIAIEAGLNPTDKELEHMRFYTESLSYQFECEDWEWEKKIAHIEGHEKLSDFDFHDSKVIFFEREDGIVHMKFRYDRGLTVAIRFEDVYEIQIRTDPDCDWISEFYCYPAFHNKEMLVFDIEYYRILCSRIVVESVE